MAENVICIYSREEYKKPKHDPYVEPLISMSLERYGIAEMYDLTETEDDYNKEISNILLEITKLNDRVVNLYYKLKESGY